MATPPVRVRRTAQHSFVATNDRGAEVRVGRVGQQGSFTPVELLLVAAAGCAAVTAEDLVVRRLGEGTELSATAQDVRPAGAHQLDAVQVGLDLDLSTLDDERRAELLAVVNRAIENLCTVTRTLKQPIPTPLHITPTPRAS
ncbi:OsmC family protein [Goodfellowiella coeruleoviolacea]|uniref:OsmC-related protein n=1 Tax=Goodfellowiella coeruleoviolacea TaxID=334858 RepID=A0AAE3GQP6_9PSEU|nr:OsmC family protein [Goodfellowiella coeruleoviolacea]MCP2170413.1 putative OsmC-related protein [Goodfellowiella coeruleoviolacea]